MTVGELIKELSTYNWDDQIVVMHDDGGAGFTEIGAITKKELVTPDAWLPVPKGVTKFKAVVIE